MKICLEFNTRIKRAVNPKIVNKLRKKSDYHTVVCLSVSAPLWCILFLVVIKQVTYLTIKFLSSIVSLRGWKYLSFGEFFATTSLIIVVANTLKHESWAAAYCVICPEPRSWLKHHTSIYEYNTSNIRVYTTNIRVETSNIRVHLR